jgi:hypothetical protein
MQQTNTRRTRRMSSDPSSVGLNIELENFLNVNASEAYKRPWHRLERGLRLNRIRKFVESEKARLNLTEEDAEYLKQRLEKALDKKLLNSKTCVVYDPVTEDIQEIKGLVYHKTAEGRMLSNIIDKKNSVTFRKKAVPAEPKAVPAEPKAALAEPKVAAPGQTESP